MRLKMCKAKSTATADMDHCPQLNSELLARPHQIHIWKRSPGPVAVPLATKPQANGTGAVKVHSTRHNASVYMLRPGRTATQRHNAYAQYVLATQKKQNNLKAFSDGYMHGQTHDVQPQEMNKDKSCTTFKSVCPQRFFTQPVVLAFHTAAFSQAIGPPYRLQWRDEHGIMAA